ncbi:DUF551 domain-containing protein [Klebsiella michiganensis]|uniref:DUF551 domain-containing protein n=1 Tax=Klebsiella michiganensis TaxID=1134687 RepID=UPI001F215BF8|nr:DUF551 domain-containing protein [Klebsiella michiganensis]UIU17793.1 DUF551 domain-containing protein [Klebsiella michiganensis]
MTSKLTITDERLEKIKSWRETYGAGSNVILPAEEAEELARIALAVIDSEPVRNPVLAYADSYRDMAKQGVESVPIWSVITDLERNIAPLYRHAQPVPVVPYDFDFDRFNDVVWLECVASNPHMHSPTTSIIARVALELNKRILAGNSPVIPDGYVMVPKEPTQAMCAAFNDSDYGRKSLRERYVAMLAAAQQPQDEPQNIPEIIPGWIPVSERMPEDRTQVILWDAEIGEVTSGHYSHKTHTFYHCGDAIQNEITHWMLPPCAPQEEK